MDATDRPAPHDLAMLLGQAGIIDRALRVHLEGIRHEQSLIAPEPAGSRMHGIVGRAGVLRRVAGEEGAIR